MLISTKGRYAVRIMVDIAQNGAGGTVKIAEICARQEITVKYAEQITALLAKGGLLHSARGVGGGYSLIKEPREYRILEILNKTEGELCPIDSADGLRKEPYVLKNFWDGLAREINGYLNSVTLQDLLDSFPNGADFYCI